jgi:arsenate reductase-like glutaredoxin family protein
MKKVSAATRYRNRAKKKAVEYYGGKCKLCGYNKSIFALDFHHVDPTTKEWNPAKVLSYKWETAKKELDKCILICSNCHRELHGGNINNELLRSPNGTTITHTNSCKHCNKQFETTKKHKKFCSLDCYRLNKRKVERPSKEELQQLISEMSLEAIGRKYGISGNAVKKWAKVYNINHRGNRATAAHLAHNQNGL